MATNIKEIVDVFLASKGLRRDKGNDGDISPLLPLIIMDTALQLFNKYIRPVECKREMKMYKNQWARLYHEFNMMYFRYFNDEQRDFVIDIMDEFDKHIEKHLFICHIQIMNKVNFEPTDRQKVLASTLLISILGQAARIIYENLFQKAKVPMRCTILEQMDAVILKWQNLYYGEGKPAVRVNDDKQVCLAVDVLLKNCVYFLTKYYIK